MRKFKPTETESRVAAAILIRISFLESMEELYTEYRSIYNDYDLFDDPFTGLPCSRSVYALNSLEYEKQLMSEKYGHCDGLC